MRELFKAGLVIALLGGAAHAQVRVEVRAPSIRWAAPPPLVVVQPGVQVVEDYDQEVYFHDNYYWYRDDGGWYRSRDHLGGWAVVPSNAVPQPLVELPRGRYRHYKAERKEEKHEEKREEHERKHEEKFERKHGGGDGHFGHGHGKH